MAVAVDFRTYKPENSRDDLVRKIEEAPLEHAQAVLAAYDLLERLHENGILDLLNGLLSAGDTVVNHVVNVISAPQMITRLRTVLIFNNLLNSLDADKLHELLAEAGGKPPSLLSMAKQATSEDARRGMATAVGLLNLFGAALKGPATNIPDR
ncbi:DUF1641 domain-containing protein [Edaphobacter aggregans]|uniref:DUF1641 domain-containing protein n=1 Tax=Edaphobacter aggregans TaxID=570835 RepID=UPI000551869B|nr:hypothetical protein [Edaphobacter aggregans]